MLGPFLDSTMLFNLLDTPMKKGHRNTTARNCINVSATKAKSTAI